MNSCSCCFDDIIGACIPDGEKITINTVLDPEKTYYYHITDKFGHEYSGQCTPLNNGAIQIPIDDLPDGLFTQYAGEFIIKISTDEDGCNTVPLLLASRYDCISLTVRGRCEKDSIGCPMPVETTAHEFSDEFSIEFN